MNPKNAEIPQNLEAEQSTLGAMQMDRGAIAVAAQMLTANDFYREHHKKIFKAMLALYEESEPVDIITLSDRLRRDRVLDEVGGVEYLRALHESCPSSVNVDSYAKVVQDNSTLRKLLQLADRLKGMVYGDEAEIKGAKAIVEDTLRAVMGIGIKEQGECVPLDNLLLPAFESLMHQIEHKGTVTGTSTGFLDIDRILCGLQPATFNILGARPKMGKSALAMQTAMHIAKKERKPVAIFSLEMSKNQLLERIICSEAGVNSQDYRQGFLDDAGKGRVARTLKALKGVPMFIEDSRNITAFEIGARARRVAAEMGQLGLIVVDYVQLVAPANHKIPRHEQVSEIARGLSSLAIELNCPVLALAQLSRNCEQREDKRPMLSDLRDSGSLEAEAHVVMFLYRDGYYRRNDPRRLPGEEVIDNTAELIIAAQRSGPVGTVELGWQGEHVRFTNLEKEVNGYGY